MQKPFDGRDLRAHPRYPTRFAAYLIYIGVITAIEVADISAKGAHVRYSASLKVGSRVQLRANKMDVTASIVRVTEGGYGLQFNEFIQPLEVVRQNYVGLEHLRRSVRT